MSEIGIYEIFKSYFCSRLLFISLKNGMGEWLEKDAEPTLRSTVQGSSVVRSDTSQRA